MDLNTLNALLSRVEAEAAAAVAAAVSIDALRSAESKLAKCPLAEALKSIKSFPPDQRGQTRRVQCLEAAFRRGLRANLLIPVQDRERFRGVVALYLDRPHLDLEPEHLDLFSLLGTQAGLICEAVAELRWRQKREELVALAAMATAVAHEIRNPLSAIRGAVELLLEKPGDRTERFLGIIRDEVVRLDRFLGDFLAYGRPGSLEIERFDLTLLAAEAAEVVSLRPGMPPIDQAGDAHLWFEGDRSHLKQVLLNLLINAGEAAGPEGRIEIHLEAESREVLFRVRDTGPGISPDAFPRLFLPFFSTKNREGAHRGGTGLGLAICARIVDLHAGRISASNWRDETGAHGAELLVRLPGPRRDR